jgi:hypothetical protein
MGRDAMSFWDIVQKLAPAMAVTPVTGAYQTVDEYGRDTTIVGTPAWRRLKRLKGGSQVGGFGFFPDAAGQVVVAHGAEQIVNPGTIFVACDSFPHVTTDVRSVFSKNDIGVGNEWELYFRNVAATDRIYFRAGTARYIDFDVEGHQTVAVTFEDGAIPRAFVDGWPIGALNDVVALASRTVEMNVGARNGNTDHFLGSVGCAILFPGILTDDEISQLDEAWRRVRVGRQPRRFRRLPGADLNGAVLDVAGDILASGEWPEQISGLNGVPSGIVTNPEGATGMRCPGFHGQGAGDVELPAAAGFSTTVLTTWMFALDFRSRGEGNQGRLIEIGNVGGVYSLRLQISLTAPTRLSYFVAFADGNAEWRITLSDLTSMKGIITVLHDRTVGGNLPRVFMDNEELTVSVITARSGALAMNAAHTPHIGNSGTLNKTADSDIGPVRFWGQLLDETQRRQELVAMINRPEYLTRRFREPVSLAAVGVDGYIGPYRVLNGGSLWWVDDGERRKALFGSTNSNVSHPSSLAYGAWYWRMLKATGSTITAFIASDNDVVDGAAQDGYLVNFSSTERLLLRRVDNGAPTTLFSTPLDTIIENVEYEVFVVRRPVDNQFQVWLRGGAFPTWTSQGTAIDTTYTDSKFFVQEHDAGGTTGSITLFPLGAGLLPTDVYPD